MKNIEIKSGNTSAEISLIGASIISLNSKDKEGNITKEAMYSYVGGNSWKGRDGQCAFHMFPILCDLRPIDELYMKFPNMGNIQKEKDVYIVHTVSDGYKCLRSDENGKYPDGYFYNGDFYQIGKHGFLKSLTFAIESQSENSIVLVTHDTLETLKQFPWKFEARLAHSIENGKISSKFEVKNLSPEPMPFFQGTHSTYATEGSLDNYIVKLFYPQDIKEVTAWEFETPEKTYAFNPSKGFRLNEEMFKGSVTLFIDKKGFDEVALFKKEGLNEKLVVSFHLSDRDNVLAIWDPTSKLDDKAGKRGLALEPSTHVQGAFNKTLELKDNKELVWLNQGRTWSKTIVTNMHPPAKIIDKKHEVRF